MFNHFSKKPTLIRKMQRHKPSFFKVILDNSIQTLRIPPVFVKNFNDINTRKRVFLKVSTRYWVVKLKRFENGLWFGKGWKSFMEDNFIEEGNFLVFKVVTGSLINVTIYDQTCCEKKKRFRRTKIVEKHDETVDEKSVKPHANDRAENCGVKERKLGGLDDANGRECLYFTEIFRDGKTLKIPRKLAEKIGDELKNVILLKVHSSDFCEVSLRKVHNKVLLGKGWESFVSKHSITDGHLLIFKYSGNSCFDVLNLDIGISHENYGVTESSTGERNTDGKCQINDEEEVGDDDEVSLVFTRPAGYTDSVKEVSDECEEAERINTRQEDTTNHIKGSKYKAISARRSSNRLQKNKKSVGKPKKPATAYMVFMEDFRKEYKILYPLNRLVTEVAKAGGKKWNSMSVVDKVPHVAEAKNRNKEYYENLTAYYKNSAAEKSKDDENSCSSRFDFENEETKGKPKESDSDEKDNNEGTEEVSDEEVSKEAYNGEGDTEEISEEEEENKDNDDNKDSKEVGIEEDDDSENKDEEASFEEDDDSEDKDESDKDDSLEEEEDESEYNDDESEEEASLEDEDDLDTVIDSEDDTYQD